MKLLVILPLLVSCSVAFEPPDMMSCRTHCIGGVCAWVEPAGEDPYPYCTARCTSDESCAEYESCQYANALCDMMLCIPSGIAAPETCEN
jgi:hypothetical protein